MEGGPFSTCVAQYFEYNTSGGCFCDGHMVREVPLAEEGSLFTEPGEQVIGFHCVFLRCRCTDWEAVGPVLGAIRRHLAKKMEVFFFLIDCSHEGAEACIGILLASEGSVDGSVVSSLVAREGWRDCKLSVPGPLEGASWLCSVLRITGRSECVVGAMGQTLIDYMTHSVEGDRILNEVWNGLQVV
jgi:hypothetical protein